MQDPQTILEIIVKSIVKKEDSVSITKETGKFSTIYCIRVDREDMGLIIGSGGATSSAIRRIMVLVGRRNHQEISIKIGEPRYGK